MPAVMPSDARHCTPTRLCLLTHSLEVFLLSRNFSTPSLRRASWYQRSWTLLARYVLFVFRLPLRVADVYVSNIMVNTLSIYRGCVSPFDFIRRLAFIEVVRIPS